VVYYKDSKYQFVKEEPRMILADLISNIGGLLGVFTGLSLISLVEIIELASVCFLPKEISNENENEIIE